MLGDMLELGENSAALHNSLGAYCAECGLDALFTAGDLASDIALGAGKCRNAQRFPHFEGHGVNCSAAFLQSRRHGACKGFTRGTFWKHC